MQTKSGSTSKKCTVYAHTWSTELAVTKWDNSLTATTLNVLPSSKIQIGAPLETVFEQTRMQTISPCIKGKELHCMRNIPRTAKYTLNTSNAKQLQLLSKCVAAQHLLPRLCLFCSQGRMSALGQRDLSCAPSHPNMVPHKRIALRNDAQHWPYFSSVPYFMLLTLRMFKFVRVHTLTVPRCWCPGKGNSRRPQTVVSIIKFCIS